MKLFVYGLGYTGAALARRLAPRGWTVTGVGRGEDDRAAVEAAQADAVLVSAPPGEDGCPGLTALAGVAPSWLGYLSTTGVYGDRGGGWVFESSALTPASAEGARRVEAEAEWRARGAMVFRLPGIYGPGRSAFDRLREGTARRLVKHGQVFSRIHVDDLAAALEAALQRPHPGWAFNLCDDEPASAADVTAYAAQLIGAPAPPEEAFDAAALSPAARRFWAESKRVSNARAKAALGWRPAYPSYREGLRAVLAAEG